MTVRENQDRWLAALRSGEYKQGTEYLHKLDGGMCCLGVAAELFKPETVERVKGKLCWYYEENSSFAPNYVIEALKLYNGLGGISDDSESLARLNDSGKTFAEIADIFEANREAYTRA